MQPKKKKKTVVIAGECDWDRTFYFIPCFQLYTLKLSKWFWNEYVLLFCKKKIIWKNYVQSSPCGKVKLGIRQLVEAALDIKKSSLSHPGKMKLGRKGK